MRNVLLFSLLFLPLTFAQSQRGLIDSELNLPKWLDLTAQSRWRAEGQHDIGFQPGNNQDFLLQRLRVGLGIKPTTWLQVYAEAQDARSPGIPNSTSSTRDTLDLRQAYVDIGKEDAWWDVKVGRQAIAFGSERVIGASDWTNPARVFDAVRLGIHHHNDRLDLFSSSVVNSNHDAWDHHTQGDVLHGAYASLGSLIPNAKIEPYVLLRFSPRLAVAGASGHYNSVTYGMRAAGTIRKEWTYELEALGQGGSIGGQQVRAWGGEAQVRRLFPERLWKPSLIAEYNFASGDKQRGDGKVNTLDQLYPTNHSIYGIADIIGRRNMRNLRVGVWAQPEKWLTVKVEGHDLRLASKNDALYAASGVVSVAAVPGGASSAQVGEELDLVGEVRVSRHYSIGAQTGHLFAGQFLQQNSPGSGRTFYATFIDFRL